MLEEYKNTSGEQRIAGRRNNWRKARVLRMQDIAYSFITQECLKANKILHEQALYEMFMNRKGGEYGLWPNHFSNLYHKMIPNLIKAVHAARKTNNAGQANVPGDPAKT